MALNISWHILRLFGNLAAQSAGAVEYTDCIPTEGFNSPPVSIPDISLNNLMLMNLMMRFQ